MMFQEWYDTLKAFTVPLRNVGRPKVTEPLIWKKDRVHPERYRQTLALTEDENSEIACNAFGSCQKICPSQIIQVSKPERLDSPKTGKKRAYPASFSIDLNACIFCEMCVQVCPTGALNMMARHQPPAFEREDLVLTMDKLLANAKVGTPSWASSTRLKEMQDPTRGLAPAEAKKEDQP